MGAQYINQPRPMEDLIDSLRANLTVVPVPSQGHRQPQLFKDEPGEDKPHYT
ncbi:unnamed protein product [marine sediment metagenome]|uniref:Uncharacterized protein n=1 Tax=marine sediment metagenome TaxID=412755 RepID=X1FTL9_9ZZZZ